MIGNIPIDQEGKITAPVSLYQPSDEVKNLTYRIQQDYQVGYELQHKPFTEFNDLSLLDRMDLDQKRWNAYREPQSTDPEEVWRWNGVRPLTRNKIIAIVAQMTSRIVIPAPYAQNDKQEEDRMAAQIMRDLMEYNIRNSNYVDNYIMWITDALVNPIAYLGLGFFEKMQTIKEENEGKISKKEVIDNVYSGFQTFNIPTDEILIGNFNQKDLSKQGFVIRKRFIEYGEAEVLWSEHDNFEFVKPGIRTIFNADNSLFYDVFDETIPTLVEEAIYYNRAEDSEIPFVNGVYVGDDDIEANPIKHRDNENRPKYHFAGLGYEHISPRFFFYKSACWKLGDDDELVQRMEQLAMDATFLETMPPTITAGHGQFTEAILIPGKNNAFEEPDVRVTPIALGRRLDFAWRAIQEKEKSMAESTQDALLQGVATGPVKTASEAMILQQNAKIALGLFGNMFAQSLKRVGGLMIDVIIQHQTVAEVEEIAGKGLIEQYKTFVLQTDEGLSKKIMFEPQELGEVNEVDLDRMSTKILDEEGGIDSNMRVYKILNPEAWRKLKYQIIVDVEELMPAYVKQIVKEQQTAQSQEMANQIPENQGINRIVQKVA